MALPVEMIFDHQSNEHSSRKWFRRIWPGWPSVSIALLMACQTRGGEEPLVLPVWPGEVPRDYGAIGPYGPIGPERVRAPSEAPTKDAKWITNVKTPTITI